MYGLTAEDYAELVRTHDGCAICQEKSKLGVDHNHTTGKVRGLLCQACNRGLGHFKDSPSLLEKAKEYVLERI
jgi:hypothetical protein